MVIRLYKKNIINNNNNNVNAKYPNIIKLLWEEILINKKYKM